VWAIVGAVVAFDAAAIVLGILDRDVQSLAATIMFSPATVGFAAFGALIVRKHRAHSIGWLFVAMAFFFSLCHNLGENYAVYALAVDPGSLPAGKVAFWLASTALDTIYVSAMLLLLLLFPDGRPLTPRWRPVVAAAIVAGICGLAQGFSDFTFSPPLQKFHNPLALSGGLKTAVWAVQAVGVPLTAIAFFGGIASMVLRFRRSTGTERQQVKWVVAGVLIWVVIFAASLAAAAAGEHDADAIPFVASIFLFPGVMGLAILRYRLYDIDLVIRKTLVYTCLVAVLGAVYLGGIALLGSLSLSITGQSGEVAVTVTTLVVALAFQPLRHRIQRAIDRRFSRRTVDAESAMRAFSGRVREEVDLDALCSELLGVVDRSLQPRHASVWLRPPEQA
jgi:cytochrome b subunit of formate dehydrogenase